MERIIVRVLRFKYRLTTASTIYCCNSYTLIIWCWNETNTIPVYIILNYCVEYREQNLLCYYCRDNIVCPTISELSLPEASDVFVVSRTCAHTLCIVYNFIIYVRANIYTIFRRWKRWTMESKVRVPEYYDIQLYAYTCARTFNHLTYSVSVLRLSGNESSFLIMYMYIIYMYAGMSSISLRFK